eukprot:11191794-Lingulodinium_polyedra.AAC.1
MLRRTEGRGRGPRRRGWWGVLQDHLGLEKERRAPRMACSGLGAQTLAYGDGPRVEAGLGHGGSQHRRLP